MITYLPTPLFVLSNAVRTLPRPMSPGPTLGTLLLIMILLTSFPGAATMTTTQQTALVGALGTNSSTMDSYLIDSCCTTSIIADPRLLSNFRCVPPVNIRGLTGDKSYTWKATLTIPLRTICGEAYLLCINNVYWDETGHYNLVLSDQLNHSGFKVVLNDYDSALQQKQAFRMAGATESVSLPVAKIRSLYLLPVYWPGAPIPDTPWQCELDVDVQFSMLANCGNLTLEELVHLLMAHTPIQ
eukprot:2904075-Rhodomonas_salina.2